MFMKTMTCGQLGGACDKEFRAETFEEMAQLSKQHGMEMFQQGDEAHIAAMNTMKELMAKADAMQEWMESKRKEFDSVREDGLPGKGP
jgi:predicted small metal-binding protein